jgi:hypothetical protein
MRLRGGAHPAANEEFFAVRDASGCMPRTSVFPRPRCRSIAGCPRGGDELELVAGKRGPTRLGFAAILIGYAAARRTGLAPFEPALGTGK